METLTEGTTFYQSITLEAIVCYSCGVTFAIPSNLRRKFLESKERFYCPNGHGQSYTTSVEERLRKELEETRRQHLRKVETLENQFLDEMNKRKRVERKLKKSDTQLKRVHAGVCPCCNRSFANLQQHMKTEHPELSPLKEIPAIHKKISSKK